MTLSNRVTDLAALDLFNEVVRRGSLSAAARAHGISQPSASATIRRLESRLGMRLLDRSPNGSRPTEAGRRVTAWSQPVIDSARVLDAALLSSAEGRSVQLRVAASFTIAEYLMPSWIYSLNKRVPNGSVQLAVRNSREVVDGLKEGLIDVGFIEGASPTPEFETRDVGGDRLILIVYPGHPWARRGTEVEAAELATTPLVMRESGSGTREVVTQRMSQDAERPLPDPLVELGSTTAVKNAVMQGVGPAMVSELAVRTELADGRVLAVPVNGMDPRRTFRAIWQLGSRPSAMAEQLLAIAESSPAAEKPR